MILLYVMVLAVAIGLALGGRVGNLANLRLRGESVLVTFVFATALVPRAFEFAPSRWHSAALAVWAVMMAVLMWLCWINVRTPGIVLLGLGLLSNSVVIVANGGMPVSAWAIHAAGGGVDSVAKLARAAFHVAGEGARLWWLGDVLPVPVLKVVMSLGDVLMFAGIAVIIVWGMRQSSGSDA